MGRDRFFTPLQNTNNQENAMDLYLNISMRKKQGKIYIAYLIERFGLVSYSYIIVHGVKLYNMGWDPFFHTFSSFLISKI